VAKKALRLTEGRLLVDKEARLLTRGRSLLEKESGPLTNGRIFLEKKALLPTNGRLLVAKTTLLQTSGRLLVDKKALCHGHRLLESMKTHVLPRASAEENLRDAARKTVELLNVIFPDINARVSVPY
jgi:hypothetical protein